jgi:SAM-dependent methyltransferase
MKIKLKNPPSDGRTFEQIRNHYEVEKAIAARLKEATKEERKIIYRTMYDELLRRVPDHPRLRRPKGDTFVKTANIKKLRLVEKFLNKSTTFVEFGPGDCSFVTSICDRVRIAYGVDISDQRTQGYNLAANFELIIYDGYDLALEEASADIVFSDQLIEHFHQEDVELHFQLVRKILKPQGVYVFRTPHRFTGPHDVSGYFSDVPEGFHLREWTYFEIADLLKDSKYLSWWGYWCSKALCIKVPFGWLITIERLFNIFPKRLRKPLSRLVLPSVIVVAVK